MANPQENLFVDANIGEESGELENNKAINETLCVLETQPSDTNIGPINLPRNISTPEKTVEFTFGVATPTPTGVSPFNYHEIHQPSEEGNKVGHVADVNDQNIPPLKRIKRKPKGIPLDIPEEKQEPDKPAKYISKIPENSTEFEYDQTIIPIDVSQLDKYAKQIDKGNFGTVYSVNIKNPREIRMAVKVRNLFISFHFSTV
ncbi:unnamed protein product [Adineta steineri]|uniref:Uncharacterized protein n=1 Tax=Adineta steineri TaxID=433720 RepID=A0A815FGR4_9BILA|nr:unnamed protein product [Adineta steineri]CAF1587149.1 unnamed protein product [Adineta steineri]